MSGIDVFHFWTWAHRVGASIVGESCSQFISRGEFFIPNVISRVGQSVYLWDEKVK